MQSREWGPAARTGRLVPDFSPRSLLLLRSSPVLSPYRGLLERGPAAAGSAAGWSGVTAVGRPWMRGHILLPREPWSRVAAAQTGEGKLWPAFGCSSAHRAAIGAGTGAGSHHLEVPWGRGGGALLSPEPYRSQKTGRRQHRSCAAGAVTLHPRRRARVGGASSRTDTRTPGLGCASVSGLWPLGPCLGSRCRG